MFQSKSKKVGAIGTILFHFFLFLICFFSSVSYTTLVVPDAIQVRYIPFQNLLEANEAIDSKIENIENIEINNQQANKVFEDLISEKSDLINVLDQKDTISQSDVKETTVEAQSISSELEMALKQLKQLNFSNDTIEAMDQTTDPQDGLDFDFSTDKNPSNIDGYVLSDNRFAVKKIKPDYLCRETGKVVVRVWVNREGFTVKAEAGIRGTTESASCLLKEAKSAALKTTWTPYHNAPEIQIGQITYNFYRN